MKLQLKMVLLNSIVMSISIITIGMFFNNYIITKLQDYAKQDMQSFAKSISSQFDATVQMMDFISEQQLGYMKVLSAIQLLSKSNREEIPPNFLLQAKREVESSLRTYTIGKNYYRVNFFNSNGVFVTSNTNIYSADDTEAVFHAFYSGTEDKATSVTLTPPRRDPWGDEDAPKVYSLVRSVRGTETPSYIEVQTLYEDLEQLYNSEAIQYDKIALINSEGKLFFSQLTQDQELELMTQVQKTPYDQWRLSDENGESSVSVVYSPYSKIYTVTARSSEGTNKIASSINSITLFILTAFCLASTLVVFLSSRYLTKPIRRLTKQIEMTSLENLDYGFDFSNPNNELVVLSEAYKQLLRRLTDSINRENKMRKLQGQAELNALQAQINPHFINGVLNVISYRGLASGDPGISTICDNLARMLRYTTNTKQNIVTVKDELEYVQMYFYLMSSRYQNQLEYDIHVDEDVSILPLPKMVFQQLVENAVDHGFRHTTDTMRVSLKGWADASFWHITVSDNGCGFNDSVLRSIQHEFDGLRDRVKQDGLHLKTEIGGMGLVNTYARLLLFYGSEVKLKIDNNLPDAGACVQLTLPLERE